MTIWEPIKVFRALRWDASLTAEQYLRASIAAFILLFLAFFFSIVGGFFLAYFQINGLTESIPDDLWDAIISRDPFVLSLLIPITIVSLFYSLFRIKLDVMRLHAFNLSGWWVLLIISITYGLSYFGAIFLAAIFSSIILYFSFFYGAKNLSKWEYQEIFEKPSIKFEWLVVTLYAIWTWYTILGDPLFIIIDMI
jgi:uncharacterized membrane protein YhaH (DUF805 family)